MGSWFILPAHPQSLTYFVTKLAATVVPFSLTKAHLIGTLFYSHTQRINRLANSTFKFGTFYAYFQGYPYSRSEVPEGY
jgi:hypothetical protein